VLEIACGRGGFAAKVVQIASQAPRFVAADFSIKAVAKGREYARDARHDSIAWHVADAQALAYANSTFDTVISCETIEHLPRPRTALAEFARVLKRGGRLFVTSPNYLGPLGLYRAYLRLRGRRFTEEGQPINRCLLLPRTAAWVETSGLRVELVTAAGHYLPWPGRPPIRVAALDRWAPLKWFALHSLLVACKP